MKKFSSWLKEERGIELPKGTINGGWFAEHDIPMIVACTCCGTTMAVVNCVVDEDGYTYCNDCTECD